jgi:N-acetylmuramoyl-L-alanine amidase/putative methionine-R-sulfoxide reductase with GAF domain
MSVTPTNVDLDSIPAGSAPGEPRTASSARPGWEALEALLAFSALHQQVRQRQERGYGKEGELSEQESGQLEQFVLDEVLQLVADRALTITGADGVAIALAESDAIICRAAVGKICPDYGMRLDLNAGFSGACLASGQIVRCDDTESDSRVNAAACRTLGTRSMVAVPLLAKQTVLGLVEAFSSEPYGFNDSDVRSLSLLAELILAALRPEEEDRLADVSQRVLGGKTQGEVLPKVPTPEPEELPEQLTSSNGSHSEPEPKADSGRQSPGKKSPPGLGIVVALVVFAAVLGAGLWWRMRAPVSKATVRQPVLQPVRPVPVTEGASTAAPSSEPSAPSEEETPPKPATVAQLATFPEVTGIRHWSSADSSTVVIDMQDQVQYEAHRLTGPERIYFDLHDTRLASDLAGKNIEIGDSLIERVRVAQPTAGITRVVLETKGASNFSVSLEVNPYRLVVEIRKIGAAAETRSNSNLFAPLDANAPIGAAARVPAVGIKSRIVLDAGHGGGDLGTVGKQGLLEKDLVLDIASRLGALLERRLGAEVIYTRKDDNYVPLEKRTEIANLAEADLFLSVHANYSDSASARGVETYYTNTYSSIKARPQGSEQSGMQTINWTNVDIRKKVRDSHRLATSVQRALYATLAKKNPGLPNRGVKEAQYVVLTGTTMPAILAEISFVSSPTDENNLQNASYRQQIAEALYQGVAQYTEQSRRVNMASAAGKLGVR